VSISISTSPAVQTEASTTAASGGSNVKTAPRTQPVFVPPDHVNLSETQQVYQLYNQGQRIEQIAASLNLTVEAVNSYLNISNSTG
jgi:DNA-binding CsgD family transcriptional regulator